MKLKIYSLAFSLENMQIKWLETNVDMLTYCLVCKKKYRE